MLFDMGLGEIFAIAVLGLVVFGPDRLPKVAAQAAHFLRQLRDQVNTAKESIVEAADIDPSTLKEIRDLDPRKALRDLASPLEVARRTANDALRLDNVAKPSTPKLKAPTTDEAATAAADDAVDAPPATGIVHDDIA